MYFTLLYLQVFLQEFSNFSPKTSKDLKVVILWGTLLIGSSLYTVFFVNWSLNYQKNSFEQEKDNQIINKGDLLHYTSGYFQF